MPFDIKDPSALLRPFKNLQQFTEELYAMFSKSVSPEPNVKAVRGKAPGEPPQPSRRSDVNSDALPSVASVRSSRLTEARSKAPSEISRTSTHKESRPRDTAKVEAPEPRREPIAHNEHFLPEIKIGAQHEKPRRSETVNRVTSFSVVDPPPASSARKPQDRSRPAPDQKRHDEPRVDHPERKPRNDDSAESRLLDIGNFATVSGGSAASSVYIGRVVSGSGDTYTVDAKKCA